MSARGQSKLHTERDDSNGGASCSFRALEALAEALETLIASTEAEGYRAYEYRRTAAISLTRAQKYLAQAKARD